MSIIDASVAIRWFNNDIWSAEALTLLASGGHTAPDLIVAEVANALWKIVRIGLLPPEPGERALCDLPNMISVLPTTVLGPRAFSIARTLNHPAYDCFYLALAEATGTALVTLDRRLFNRTRGTPWADLTTLLCSDPALT